MQFYLYYLALGTVGVISVMMIEESRLIGRPFEKFFGLRVGEFYRHDMRLHWLVSLCQWPLFLFLVGWVADIPSLEWDFILLLIGGILIEFVNYFRPARSKVINYQRA